MTSDLIEGIDYYLHLVRMPSRSVPAAVTPGDDGVYNVYIDERLTREEQRAVLQHELRHIRRDDFNNGLPIGEIEK